MYLIRFKKSAEKEIEKLPASVVKKIAPAINSLAKDPRPKGAKKLESKEEIWRIRIGDYRVLYAIEDVIKIIEVRNIGHRKDIYKK